MSGQLITAVEGPHPRSPSRRLGDGAYLALVLGTFAVLGLAAGGLWRWWWDAPSGMVVQGHWYAGVVSLSPVVQLSEPNQASASATIEWTLIALALGVIGGVVAVVGARGREFAAVAVALIGSAGAALIMLATGLIGRGADPAAAALNAKDGTVLLGRLSLVEPWLLGIPVAAAGTVVAIAFLGWSERSVARHSPATESAPG